MNQISFNIYEVKLNKGHFSFGTVIIPYLDKHYQEIDSKSDLNSVLLCKTTVPFAHVLFRFISLYLFVLNFAMRLKDANYKVIEMV